jgi:probable phosphoglycerate mutase
MNAVDYAHAERLETETAASAQRVYLVRHGETTWSASGRHTGVTDLPLTRHGEETARRLVEALAPEVVSHVLTSPMLRARRTCELAGLGARAKVDPDLVEWNYGDYEGLTTQQIHATAPGWTLFADGCPAGESPGDVRGRVDRVIERVRALQGDVALFAHGHVFRVLAARWLGLPVTAGSYFLLDTATLSILGYYRGVPAVQQWNAPLDRNSAEK